MRGNDAREFIFTVRTLNVIPHVAQNKTNRKFAIDGRTTRHQGYAASQRLLKWVEETFGCIKTIKETTTQEGGLSED